MHLIGAKLNCDVTLFANDLGQALNAIKDALLSLNGAVAEVNDQKWAFADNHLVRMHDGAEVVAGRLGKQCRLRRTDLIQSSFVQEHTPAWVYANYILDFDSERMLIEEKTKQLEFAAFADAWTRIIMGHQPGVGYIYIGSIEKVADVWNRIRALKIVTNADFVIRNPNYGQKSEWECLAQELAEANAREGKRSFENPAGLNVESPMIRAGIAMAADSYAEFRIRGLDSEGTGRKIESGSKSAERRTLEDVIDDPADFAAKFYSELQRIRDER